jgi:hypothetical protein
MVPSTPADAALRCDPKGFDQLGPPPNALLDQAQEDPAGEPAETVPPQTATDCAPFVYRMGYPLAVPQPVLSSFGVIRDGGDRWHAGIDIETPKLTPVVAVADGTVWTMKVDADNVWITILHPGGWSSAYVHLNNDISATDDGRGFGIRSDLDVGDPVFAGMVLGWGGDSGNAEEAPPHLHFELRDPSGMPIDPYSSLMAALRRRPPGVTFAGAFADDDNHRGEALFDLAVTLGVPAWCDVIGTQACPDGAATRSALVEWSDVLLPEDAATIRQQIADREAGRLLASPAAIEPVLDCESPLFCDQGVTGSELIQLLGSNQPVTDGACGRPIDDEPLTREQMLRRLLIEAEVLIAPPCDLIT